MGASMKSRFRYVCLKSWIFSIGIGFSEMVDVWIWMIFWLININTYSVVMLSVLIISTESVVDTYMLEFNLTVRIKYNK